MNGGREVSKEGRKEGRKEEKSKNREGFDKKRRHALLARSLASPSGEWKGEIDLGQCKNRRNAHHRDATDAGDGATDGQPLSFGVEWRCCSPSLFLVYKGHCLWKH